MLSIIIVNYKSVQHILNCLESASRYPGFLSYEWIVVDNEVDGRCEELINQAFPAVKYYSMGYNAGFARANNEGMRKASGDFFYCSTLMCYFLLMFCRLVYKGSKNLHILHAAFSSVLQTEHRRLPEIIL